MSNETVDDQPQPLDTVVDEWQPSYPKELRTRSGLKIEVRPVEADDADELREGFEHLSAASKRARFHTVKPELTEGQVRYLTDIDHDHHEALAARVDGRDGLRGIAVARYVRLDDEPEVAEVAVTVDDDYQSQGVGSAVFDELSQLAYRKGVRWFRGWILPDNSQAIEFFTSRGAASRFRDGLIVIELPLPFPEPFRPHRWLPPQTRLYRWVRKVADRHDEDRTAPASEPPTWTTVRVTATEAGDIARALEAHGDRFADLAARFRHYEQT
jgi:GNAT superfamily N-acetyltransferase